LHYRTENTIRFIKCTDRRLYGRISWDIRIFRYPLYYGSSYSHARTHTRY